MSITHVMTLAVAILVAATAVAADTVGYCTIKGSVTEKNNIVAANTALAALQVLGDGFEVIDNCKGEAKCPDPLETSPVDVSLCLDITESCSKNDDDTFDCKVTCLDYVDKPCVIDIIGDPHLVGFDGSRFDFHGIPERSYLLFGAPNGDSLTGTMREYHRSHTMSDGTVVAGTLFKQVGIRTGAGNDRVKVALTEKDVGFSLRVEANGHDITKDVVTPSVAIKFWNEKKVTVTTTAHTYTVLMNHGESDVEGHLNINVGLVRMPKDTDKYTGVLGTTLNRKLGHAVAAELDTVRAANADLEREFEARFEVPSLFDKIEPTTRLTGIVARMAQVPSAHSVSEEDVSEMPVARSISEDEM